MQGGWRSNGYFGDGGVLQYILDLCSFLQIGVTGLIRLERVRLGVADGVQGSQLIKVAGQVLAPVAGTYEGQVAYGLN